MPKITRWHLKIGLIYFIASLFLAVLFRLQPFTSITPQIHTFRPVYYHMLMVGWMTQIIIGVSIWMFPRLTRENPRGSEVLNWLTFYCLNIGLLLRIASEPFISLGSPSHLFSYLLFFSGILQWLAAISYATNIWRRIKPK